MFLLKALMPQQLFNFIDGNNTNTVNLLTEIIKLYISVYRDIRRELEKIILKNLKTNKVVAILRSR